VTAKPVATRQRLLLEFTITADDYVDGSRAYYRNRPMFGWIVGPVLVAAFLAAFFFFGSLIWLWGVPVGLFATAAGKVRWVDRLLLQSNPQARVGTRFEFEFTGSGLRYSNAGLLGLIEWSAITAIREGDRAIALMAGRAPVAFIPKRAFESQRDLGDARAMIAAKMNGMAPQAPAGRWWWPVPLLVLVVFVVTFVVAVVTALMAT
jgi:hypothetical protein